MAKAIEDRDNKLKAANLQVSELQKKLDKAEAAEDLRSMCSDLDKRARDTERLNDGLKNKFMDIVGIMQGSGLDKEVFENVYEIAKEQAGLKPVGEGCLCNSFIGPSGCKVHRTEKPICVCGRDEDPEGKFPRRDMICPKHDR